MSEDKKEGFSYTSENVKIKKAFNLFGIELVGVIVAGLVVILLLNYLNIISFSFLKGTPLGFLIPQNNKNTVKVISDIPGYTVTITKSRELIDTLKSWGAFDREYSGGYGIRGTTAGKPIKNIVAHLTSVEQPINQFVDSDGVAYLSSITDISPSTMKISIYIAPSILTNPENKDRLGRYFESQFFTTIFRLVNPATKMEEYKMKEKELSKFFLENNEKKVYYFSVKER